MKQKLFALCIIGLLLIPTALFAQRGATQTAPSYNLTINVTPNNVGAKIFVDNVEVKGNVASVRSGSHTIKVTATGYQDFNSTVNVTANMTVPVTLVPLTANLTVNVTPANVGAKIFVNNVEVKGNVATIPRGPYTLKVTATGYVDFNSTGNLTANTTVPVTLIPLTANLTIAVTPGNVGAKIFINNAEIKGNVMTLPLGNYAVKVTAPNYLDYNTTVNLTGNSTLPVTLQPATATVNVVLQQTSRAKELVNNYLTQMSVFIDGVKQNLPGNATSFIILSGQRNVRIVSGAMQAEINFNFLPGKVYTIEPVYTLIIRE